MMKDKNSSTLKNISLIIMTVFYLVGGINHFLHPDAYYPLIPAYLPFHSFINIVSGAGEIVFGSLLIFPSTRKAGAFGIITLLIIFIPAHIYMIQKGGCMSPQMCLPPWVAWVRLFPLQFILIAWARWHAK
jgi:uncharacterized membrane protein